MLKCHERCKILHSIQDIETLLLFVQFAQNVPIVFSPHEVDIPACIQKKHKATGPLVKIQHFCSERRGWGNPASSVLDFSHLHNKAGVTVALNFVYLCLKISLTNLNILSGPGKSYFLSCGKKGKYSFLFSMEE